MPGSPTFPDGPDCDQQGYCAIQPPPAEGGVGNQPDEDGSGQVGAEQVLGAFPGGCGRAEPLAQAALGDAQRRLQKERPGG